MASHAENLRKAPGRCPDWHFTFHFIRHSCPRDSCAKHKTSVKQEQPTLLQKFGLHEVARWSTGHSMVGRFMNYMEPRLKQSSLLAPFNYIEFNFLRHLSQSRLSLYAFQKPFKGSSGRKTSAFTGRNLEQDQQVLRWRPNSHFCGQHYQAP